MSALGREALGKQSFTTNDESGSEAGGWGSVAEMGEKGIFSSAGYFDVAATYAQN